LKDNNYEFDFIYDWVKKNGSPKTHSTMVPGNEHATNNHNGDLNNFKLNASIEKNGKPANGNLMINTTVGKVNTIQLKEPPNINKKPTMGENVTSGVMKLGPQNSMNDIENSNKIIRQYEERNEKKKKNPHGCCFA